MNFVKKAEEIAREAHKDQKRWGGDSYIIHPEWIVNKLKERGGNKEFVDLVVMIGWLHDVVEDSNISIEDLEKVGFPEKVIIAIIAITKLENEEYLDYILKVGENYHANFVKRFDIEHNMLSIPEGSSKLRMEKYKLAKYILEYF